MGVSRYDYIMMKNDPTMTAPVKYYVGDLCYVMHDEWNEFCDLTIDGYGLLEGEFELADGRKFVTFNTAYGDGHYNDQDGRPYAVDAGLIGAIRVEDIRDPDFAKTLELGLGQVHEFDREIGIQDCDNTNGVITIYTVSIDTAGDYDDEGEDDYEEDEYSCELGLGF